MPAPPRPAGLDAAGGQRLDDVEEMTALLRRLRERASLLSVRVDGARGLHPSAVLEVEPKRGAVVLDMLNDAAAHRCVSPGVRLEVTAYLEGARVRFSAPVLAVEEGGLARYRLALPSAILYQQSREFFRVPVRELGVAAHLRPAGGAPPVKGRISNLSPAGIGLWLDAPVRMRFRPGEVLAGCRMDLCGETVAFDLEIRHLKTSRRHAGLYLGGRFRGVDPAHQRLLQRFLAEVQRARARAEPA